MLTYPDISPVAIAIGSFEVHWYGLMYLLAFGAGWGLGLLRTRRSGTEWRAAEISDLVFYFALGAVLGGRIGYTLLYNFAAFTHDPLLLFRIWEGGMSYHGGMIGVFVAMWLYGRHTGRTFFQVTDYLAPLVPPGLAAGRMGNFINGELWGGPTDMPWGMVFLLWTICRGILRCCTNLFWKAWSSLLFCGYFHENPVRPWRSPGCI